jgi:protoheme ferro-lyase
MEYQKNILIKVILIIVIVIKHKINERKIYLIDIQTTFQSRFGPQEWLTPYTDKTLESLPEKV